MFDIFLSHSYLDKEEVWGLYFDLKRKGYNVYVDWIVDPHLDRSNVTKESAQLVKTRMKNSKSLLLAVSYNASVSKWMPWELGFVDGNTDKCAIVPVSEGDVNRASFKGVEYLALYPFVTKDSLLGTENLIIVESPSTYVSMYDWIKSNAKPTFKSRSIF
ncbi:hypothetical protein BEL04_21295 [Mucilaginibacter sp. PPCGB 2223]|nr:hypothetical protein BEL04_21295 [Mucilaginibacter sp. PPCGB 2223]